MKRKRFDVVFILRDFSGAGVERATINLANGLAVRGHSVTIVLLKDQGPLKSKLNDHVHAVSLNTDVKGLKTILLLRKLICVIRPLRPDFIVSSLESLTVLARLCLLFQPRSCRLIIRVATTFSEEKRSWMRATAVQLCYKAHRGYFVFNSHGSLTNFSSAFANSHHRLRLISNGFDIDAIIEASSSQNPLFSTPTKYLLAVGRLAPAKRFDLLLKAFSKSSARESHKLVIAGDGPERHSLLNLADALGISKSCLFPGFVNNPYALMKDCSVFILCSDFEGSPNVLAEALVCGAPVIATDCPSGPRELLEGGKYGKLVPTDDVDALSIAISKEVANHKNHRPPRNVSAKILSVEEAVAGWESLFFEAKNA